MMSRPRGVLFDAVGTLIYPEPSAADVYVAAAARQGVVLPTAEVARRFRAALRDAQAIPSNRTDERRERHRWQTLVARVLPEVPDGERLFTELWAHFAQGKAWRCFPDVAPTLAALRDLGCVWGIASNFDGRLHSVVRELPDLAAAAVVVVSSEVGWCKPAPQFFHAAAAALGLPLRDLLMVGDDAVHDVSGGAAAGMRVCHLDRAGGPGAIASLLDIIPLCHGTTSP
jgi:putative hydrolase of the HAD superfamily